MHAVAKALVMTAFLLPMAGREGCDLDQAQIAAVPPSTFQVLATYRCGGVTCWRRWAEVNGKAMGESYVCEDAGGAAGGGELKIPKGD